MPLTKKGRKIMSEMKDKYGEEKGESVFYASANAGKIKGVHRDSIQTPNGKKPLKKSAAGCMTEAK